MCNPYCTKILQLQIVIDCRKKILCLQNINDKTQMRSHTFNICISSNVQKMQDHTHTHTHTQITPPWLCLLGHCHLHHKVGIAAGGGSEIGGRSLSLCIWEPLAYNIIQLLREKSVNHRKVTCREGNTASVYAETPSLTVPHTVIDPRHPALDPIDCPELNLSLCLDWFGGFKL